MASFLSHNADKSAIQSESQVLIPSFDLACCLPRSFLCEELCQWKTSFTNGVCPQGDSVVD